MAASVQTTSVAANSSAASTSGEAAKKFYDAVIVGAGFTGLYMLYKLREQGLAVRVYDEASEVGGTWFWNRYPGARCDVESVDYSYTFSAELEQEWSWTERYPAQPEILRYLQHVAERFSLRKDIELETRIVSAHYADESDTWTVQPAGGEPVECRFCIMATGSLSVPKDPNLPGIGDFRGPVHHTARWPEQGVDFSGQRVGVVGTGSSGIQAIPIIAEQAEHLTVFQRTPAFSVPARNHPLDAETVREIKATYPERRRIAKSTPAGLDLQANDQSALSVSAEERHREHSRRWAQGGFVLLGAYNDLMVDQRANDTIADFLRNKIRETVRDPEAAEKLLPWEYPFGTKRPCYDTGYYETYNRDDVALVDLRRTTLETVTPNGIRTSDHEHRFDSLVLATGFDAMTGALSRIDVRGRNGASLTRRWAEGPRTYLGLGITGFPNMFTLAGPGSPSVLTNMITAIEQHVEWTAECIAYVRANGYTSIEAESDAEDQWVRHVNEVADQTLYGQASSWYLGANVPGKLRIFMPYAGGMIEYRRQCDEVAAQGYSGFTMK